MKYLSIKPLENGKRQFMDLGSYLSPHPLQLFPHFFFKLCLHGLFTSWPIWGTWGLVLGDMDTIVSKVVP